MLFGESLLVSSSGGDNAFKKCIDKLESYARYPVVAIA